MRKICSVLFVCMLAAFDTGATPKFCSAKPVWPAGRERELNLTVGFTASFDGAGAEDAVLRMTGATMCRVFLNGAFFAYGPARGPHGYVRVDEWPLKGRLLPGRNTLAIEVAGYNANSYYTICQPSFLQAEVVAGGRTVVSTQGDGTPFTARVLPERIQKVQRYSFQRPFSEAYALAPGWDAWRGGITGSSAVLAVLPERALLPRIVPLPLFSVRPAETVTATGKFAYRPDAKVFPNRAITSVGVKSNMNIGFLQKDLTTIPFFEVQRTRIVLHETVNKPCPRNIDLPENSWTIVDFGCNDSGFPGMTLRCDAPTTVYFVFDEILSGNDVSLTRMGSCNVVTWKLTQPGEYKVESFEPYTFRYAKIMTHGAPCRVENIYLREYLNPETTAATFHASDAGLNKIFEAARLTFMENAVDGFMDCPSRERAGWLCDSFFTGRVSFDLTGNDKQERIFLENYLLPKSFAHLPEGMLPMCYPSDHPDGNFIPNWAMWFVLELDEYYGRSGDRAFVDAFRPRVLALLAFLRKYRNSDGLLEKLPQWVFIEWSRSNALVQDVNYPSNMTWAEVLSCAARLYRMPELEQEAEHVRETIRKQSWNGEFFVDNALRREDGSLVLSGESTETCQYYAFFFKTATPASHPALWARMCNDFGPRRHKTGKWPKIAFSNAFVGNYLRLEILSREGLSAQILNETKDYFLGMANRTGTLWENDTPSASCCHGFASHVARVMYRDVLGIRKIDIPGRKITLAFADLPLLSCKGTQPLSDGLFTLRWIREGKTLRYAFTAPAGFTVEVKPSESLNLERIPGN